MALQCTKIVKGNPNMSKDEIVKFVNIDDE